LLSEIEPRKKATEQNHRLFENKIKFFPLLADKATLGQQSRT